LKALPPIHPGEFLRETLDELELSQAEFARTIGVTPTRISQFLRGVRPVTAELALLFGRALGQSPQYWLNLQAAYDLEMAERAIGKRLNSITEIQPSDSEEAAWRNFSTENLARVYDDSEPEYPLSLIKD